MYDTSIEITGYHDDEVVLPSDERTSMRARRDSNRKRLRLGLEEDKKPSPIGLHTQGSYAMRTMVQDDQKDYDIDDGAYFKKDDLVGERGAEMSALAVRQMVCAALQHDKFKTPPEVLKNCVRVFYDEGFHVDVPSYRRIEEKDAWTGKLTYSYELASSDWKSSDARAVTNWFKSENKRLSHDFSLNDGQYCRIVRLLKVFARSRSSWKPKIATGFMITILAAEKFVSSPGRDDISLRDTMKAMRSRLEGNTIIYHPTLQGEKVTRDDDPRPIFLKDRLAENLKYLEVLDESSCAHVDAMKAWDNVFSTDWFSEQPDASSNSGGTKGMSGGSVPSRPVEKRDGGRYAL
jgi:hypothetical protein